MTRLSPSLILLLSFLTAALWTSHHASHAYSMQVEQKPIEERVLKPQAINRVEKSVDNLSKKGFLPMDATVISNGRRATFSVRMAKFADTFDWTAKFDLSDSAFESAYEKLATKKFRLVWHEEYELKSKTRHACIWHYDEDLKHLSKAAASDKDNRPEAQPMGVVWKMNDRIPVDGDGLPVFEKLESKILDFMRANQMPGLSLAISFKGELAYHRSFGYCDLNKKKKLKINQPLRTGDLSKLITSVAVLQLCDRGKLQLNQPVYELLNDIKPWKPAAYDQRLGKITVLNLLQATGGHDQGASINPGLKPRAVAGEMGLKKLITPVQCIQYMKSQPLDFNPGERSSSSDYGFFLLGRVIEKVSGASYEKYVLNNIAKPLGLSSLVMTQIDPDKRGPLEVKHQTRAGHFFPQLAGKDAGKWVINGAGVHHWELLDASLGWASSTDDMLKLSAAIQANPSPLLSTESKLVMVAKPQYVLDRPDGDKKRGWIGCGVNCRGKSSNITFLRFTQTTATSAALVCHTAGPSWCFIFNCHETASNKDPARLFDRIVGREAFKVRRAMRK